MTPRFGIVGAKNTGKTTLVCGLVSTFVGQGLRVATVKHAHHSFEIDHEGTDSYNHRLAGATEVAVVSDTRWAIVHELRNEAEPDLDAIIAKLSPADLILIEGFKKREHPKLEIRLGDRVMPQASYENVVGVVGDGGQFRRDDVREIARYIAERCGLRFPAGQLT